MISSRACLMCMWSWCHSACDGENCNKKLSLGLSDYKMINEACEWLGLCCLSELPVLSGSCDISRSLHTLSRGNSELGSLGVVTPQGHRGHFLFCGSETLHCVHSATFTTGEVAKSKVTPPCPELAAAWLVSQLTVTSDTWLASGSASVTLFLCQFFPRKRQDFLMRPQLF